MLEGLINADEGGKEENIFFICDSSVKTQDRDIGETRATQGRNLGAFSYCQMATQGLLPGRIFVLPDGNPGATPGRLFHSAL